MKILHVMDFSLPDIQSGYSIRSKYIVDNQKELGFEPVVLTRHASPRAGGEWTLPVEEELDGVRYLREPSLGLAPEVQERMAAAPDFTRLNAYSIRRRFRKHISRAVRKEAPDLLHAASPATIALWSSEVGRQWGLPVLYEVRGLWHDTSVALGTLAPDSEAYRMRHRMFLLALERADRIVTLGETLKNELVREGIPPEKIALVPNGVDTETFVPRPRPQHLAESLGIDPGHVVIGHIGSIRKLEGLHLLLHAAKQMQGTGLPVRLLIVGGGDELDPLRALADRLGITPAVHFTGRVPHGEILDYYSLIDIFVMPRTRSRVTEFVTPIKPYEAMAMAKAVIVSDVGALREIVDPGRTGLVCAADDAEELARRCADLVRDDRLRDDLGRNARAWVVEHRRWRTVVARYGDLYRDMLRPRCTRVPGPSGKRIVFYRFPSASPHVRACELLLVRSLARSHRLHVISAEPADPDPGLPPSVEPVSLPPFPDPREASGDAVERRKQALAEAVQRLRPDVLIVSTFPFEGRSLRAELLPAIEAALSANPDLDVLCSLSEIPAARNWTRQDYDALCPTLYAYFDALLVHTDPCSDSLDRRFPWTSDIPIPIVHTGPLPDAPDGTERAAAWIEAL